MKHLKHQDIGFQKIIFGFLIFLFFVSFSFSIASGYYVIPIIVFFSAILLYFSKFLLTSLYTNRDGVFWILFSTIILSPLLESTIGLSLAYVITALLLAITPLVFTSIYKVSKGFNGLKIIIILIISFYILGLVSSFLGRSKAFPAIYSAIIYLKPLVLLGFGAVLNWNEKSQKLFFNVIKWAWLPLLFFALLQWFAPSIYKLFIHVDVDLGTDRNPFFPSFPRASSIFGQSSILASFSVSFALYLIAKSIVSGKSFWFLTSVYVLLLLMTGQRQEIMVFMALLPLLFVIKNYSVRLTTILFVSFLGLGSTVSLISYLAPDIIQSELENWDFSDRTGANMSARAILYSDSFKIANKYWPKGSGFGTFASVGAVKYDQSQYLDLGYQAFWWYRLNKSWLMDAYWAKYIAETGWLGFGIQLIIYILVLNKITNWTSDKTVKRNQGMMFNCLVAFAGLFYVIATSPTAFNMAEAHGGLIPLMFVGIAWKTVKSQKPS